jgi:hypothetical protein
MKVLLDIKNKKAPFMMELLQTFSFVKAKPLSAYKSKVFEDLQQSVEELNLIKAGKLKGIPAKQLLNEL